LGATPATALKLTTGLRARIATARTATATTAANPEAPVPVTPSVVPPTGRRLSSDDVLEIADALPKMRHVRAKYRGSYGGAYLKGPGRWQVSYFSRPGKEIGQVIISDASGRVLEQWTGFQVAWTMARGYPGAFGRHVNALYIWLPLCALFMLPFIDWRRPFSLRHLDLLMLLSFSVSLAYFNHGNIYKSVPLTYPPLVYLLVRMLLLARRHRAPPPVAAPPAPAGLTDERSHPKLLIPAPWLAVGVVFLLGFRIGLNVTDSNVIDVGYAGVIGAQRIADGKALYGGYPANNEHGDTYGPVNYEAYVPFEQIFGWSGLWDDLPAAHAAAIAFDLLAVGLLVLLGLRIRGPTLAVALAYAWVSYPFTLYALESNSNDTLVAVLLLAVLLAATSPPTRGAFAALAGLTKIAPLALAPLLATHGLHERRLRGEGRTAVRPLALFALAFLATVAVVSIPALAHDSLHEIYERTVAYQANRGSPFSVWGLYGGLKGWQTAVQIAAVVLAVALAVIPRAPGPAALAAAAAAILIALQLGIEHWFYLYIPWFFPLVMIALLGSAATGPRERAPTAPGQPAEQEPVSALAPARSSPLAAA
jgi:Glycosyltransferase family 87